MSIEITVEPVSSWNQRSHPSLATRCPPGCVPEPLARRECPPGCIPADFNRCPPGYRRVERLYKCRPASNRSSPRLSPRLSQIIDQQLRRIAEGQQRQQHLAQASQLQRTQSEIAISPNPFALASPVQNVSAHASGYALSHAASVSASVDQLPAAIREVLSVADNVVPQAGKVTYINSASCPPASPPPRVATPPPPPPPQPRRVRPVYIPRPRPSSPYEVLPVIHVDRCDPCDPCNRNRRLDADCCQPAQSTRSDCCGEMTIEIEISQPKC